MGLYKEINHFIYPHLQNRPIPFWFWNFNEQTDYHKIIEDDIYQMYEKGLGGFVIFNKPPFGFSEKAYLGRDWFNACRIALDAASKYSMNVWINDGFDYPPGGLAGKMRQLCPEAVHQELVCEKIDYVDNKFSYSLPQGSKLISAIAVPESNELNYSVDIKDSLINGHRIELSKANWQIYIVSSKYITRPDGFLNHFPTYLDPEVSKIFIQEVYEQYKTHLGDYFGSPLIGFFSDCDARASHLYPWARDFIERFIQEKGYDITNLLLLLWFDFDQITPKIRMDYYEFVSSLYASWFKNNYNWCSENGLQYTYHTSDTGPFSPFEGFRAYCRRSSLYSEGRYHEVNKYATFPGTDHELLSLAGQLHFGMAFNGKKEEFLPKSVAFGMGCLKDSYERMESQNKTFGDIRAKYASSVAHINNRQGAMCELFAATNWDVTFEDFRKISDWQAVQGITFFIPHAFYSSLEGTRKQFAPPNHFKQSHLWKHYKEFSEYIGRISYLLSKGIHIADISVLDTSLSVWTGENRNNDSLFYIADILNHSPWDYDVVCEQDIISAQIEEGRIKIGEENFKVIILPFHIFHNDKLVKKIKDFNAAGGIVICCDDNPQDFLAGNLEIVSDFRYPNDKIPCDNELITKLHKHLEPDCVIKDSKGREIKGVHFCHRRYQSQDIYFIANLESKWSECRTVISLRAGKGVPVLWNQANGERIYVEYKQSDKGTEIFLDDIKYPSFFIVFEDSVPDLKKNVISDKKHKIIPKWQIKLSDKNICPLVLWKNQSEETILWGKDYNFKFIKSTFSSEQLKQLNLSIPAKIDKSLIRFNDTSINDLDVNNEIVFDERYISFDISKYLLNGTNTVLIENLDNKLFKELEYSPIYLKGDFKVNLDINENSRKFDYHSWYHFKSFIYEGTNISLEKPQQIKFGDITKQGYPFYLGQIIYEASIDLPAYKSGDWVTVDFGSVNGAVEVYVNDKLISNLIWEPFNLLLKGLNTQSNKITVKYTGTFANILEGYPSYRGLGDIGLCC